MTGSEGTLVYRSGRDRVIRALNVGSLFFAALMLWLLTLPPGPQAPPERPGERVFVTIVAVVFGLGTPLGLFAYGKRYVSSLAISADGKTAIVRVVGFFTGSERRVPVAELFQPRVHAGKMQARQQVNAPWLSLKVRNAPGLVIDLQGEVVDGRKWEQFLDRVDAA